MEIDLYKLYDENIKEFEEIDKIIKEKRISLFGAGVYGRLCLSYMQENNYKVVSFIDNDIDKQNKKISGIPVLSYENSKDYDVILVTSFSNSVINEILSLHKNANIISFNKWMVLKNINSFIDVEKILSDEKSKKVLNSILYSKIKTDNSILYEINEDKQYFCIPHFTYLTSKEIFLDAGAYVGDTIENFIINNTGTFNKIYAFEPGDRQFKSMKTRINRLIGEWAINNDDIILNKLGLSNYHGESYFEETTSIVANFISNVSTNNKIEVNTVDNFLKGKPITFLKSDIEGEELNMLKGASETIKKYKPKMAISVYHKPDDLLTIPKFIKELVPEYNLALRHHSITFDGTVLYCWIDEDQTRPDQTRPDQTRPDQTRPDQTRPDQT